MAEFKAGIRLEGDSTSAVAATEAQVEALNRLDQAAEDAARDAQALMAVLGGVRPPTQAMTSASAATKAYANETRLLSAAINDFGDRVDATRARINPFVAAQRDYLARQAEINDAQRTSAVTELEAVRAHNLNRTAYASNLNGLRSMTAATRTHTGAVKLQSYQIANLFQQLQDVGVQGVMGTNPLMIMAMQGPQITSAMGGVKNSLALVKPLFTTTRIAVGGLTASLTVGALAWNSYLNSIKSVEAAAAGRGRILGISPGDLESIAATGAAAGDISRKTAREAEVAFLSTGKIGRDMMADLIASAKDYAATIGTDVDGAISDLADKFSDPVKGAEEFRKSLDSLDDKTSRYIHSLMQQNRLHEAQAVLFQAVKGGMVDAAENTTVLGRGWDSVSKSLSDTWDWLGRTIELSVSGPQASADALAGLKDKAAELRTEIANTGEWKQALFPQALKNTQTELRMIDGLISNMERRLGRVSGTAQAADINRASSRAGTTARGLTPGLNELDALRGQQADMRGALHDPAIAGATDDIIGVANAYGRVTEAINTYLTPAQRALETDRLATAALTARSPAAKADIAARQKRLELQGQTLTASERETQVAAAGALALASATQGILDQNASLGLNTRATLGLADAWLKGAEAAQVAEARRTALAEAFQSGADVETQTRLQLAAAVAAQAEAGAQAVNDINAQADAQTRLADVMLIGGRSSTEANAAAARDAALKPLLIARSNAEGEARVQLTAIIDRLTAAYDRLGAGQARSAAAGIIQGQNDDIERMRLEIGMFGQSAQARATSLAVLQAEQQMRQQGINLYSAEGQEILRNARMSSELNLVLERQNGLYQELGSFGERSLDKINDAIMENGLSLKTLSDITRSVVADMAAEFLKLAALNPLKNAMFGTNYSTLGDAGGLIGSLFSTGVYHDGGEIGHPSRTRMVSPEVFRGAPRFHTGGLVSGERAIIVEDTEEVVTDRNPRHIKNFGKGARGASSSSGLSVTNNVFTSPGTTATTKTSQDAQGNLTLDTFIEQVEDKMASRGRSGQGKLFPAIGGQFGLNPNAGRARSGK